MFKKRGDNMATATFKVNNDILNWVLQIAGTQLNSEWINKINTWIKGEKTPTINQLKNLSQKSQIPFGNFFLSQPPRVEMPLLQFRTIDNSGITDASHELLSTIDAIQLRAAWLEDYRIKEGYSKIAFIGMGNKKKYRSASYKEIAEEILKYFDLVKGWNSTLKSNQNAFNFLRKKLSQKGIVTETGSFVGNKTRDSLNINEFRAFVLINKYAPFIFINTKDSKNARLFSLVHELVHLWYEKTEIFNYNFQTNPQYLNKKLEQQVNKISECILFDKDIFVKAWIESNDLALDKIYEIAKKFKTSPIATAITAKNYGLITQRVVDEVKGETTKNVANRKNKGGPNFYDTLAYRIDINFATSVINSTEAGDTTYLDAFSLLNVKNMKGYDSLKQRVEEKM